MTNEHYTAPSASLENTQVGARELLQPLLATKPWVRLCSIVGFVMTGFMVLAGIFMIIGMGAVATMGGDPGMAGMGVGFGIFGGVLYMLLSLIYFFPSLFLHRYANSIAQADRTNSNSDIAKALEYQKSFWKFVGIMTLIFVSFFLLGMLLAIIGGIAAA